MDLISRLLAGVFSLSLSPPLLAFSLSLSPFPCFFFPFYSLFPLSLSLSFACCCSLLFFRSILFSSSFQPYFLTFPFFLPPLSLRFLRSFAPSFSSFHIDIYFQPVLLPEVAMSGLACCAPSFHLATSLFFSLSLICLASKLFYTHFSSLFSFSYSLFLPLFPLPLSSLSFPLSPCSTTLHLPFFVHTHKEEENKKSQAKYFFQVE